MGRKRNPKSQENHRQNPRFLQIPLLQISKNPSQINVVRVLHGEPDKGFGFIAPDEGGKDVFVHITALREAGLENLQDDQKVEYELQSGRDGRSSAGALQLL